MINKPQMILNDGTIYYDSNCGYADKRLWCWMKNMSFKDVFAIFTNEEKTKTIIYQYIDREVIYKGFTDVELIRNGETGVDVCLTGESTSVEERYLPEGEENGTV